MLSNYSDCERISSSSECLNNQCQKLDIILRRGRSGIRVLSSRNRCLNELDSHVTLAPSAGNRRKLQEKIQTALLEFSLTLVLHDLQKTEQRDTQMDVACKKYQKSVISGICMLVFCLFSLASIESV